MTDPVNRALLRRLRQTLRAYLSPDGLQGKVARMLARKGGE